LLFLLHIPFMPAPLTLNTTGIVVVDDSNLTSITYLGTWQIGGVQPEYNSTTHGTDVAGSTATFVFNGMHNITVLFNFKPSSDPIHQRIGTAVAVYGTLSIEGAAISTYSLDDTTLVTFTAPSVQEPVYQTLFYQSPSLQDGLHHLVITSLVTNATFWLDYILYQPIPAQNVSPSITTTATVNASKSNPTSLPSSLGGTQRLKVGSGVIVAIALLLLLTISFIVWHFKRRRFVPHRERNLLGSCLRAVGGAFIDDLTFTQTIPRLCTHRLTSWSSITVRSDLQHICWTLQRPRPHTLRP
jgi:hypothetical protein